MNRLSFVLQVHLLLCVHAHAQLFTAIFTVFLNTLKDVPALMNFPFSYQQWCKKVQNL